MRQKHVTLAAWWAAVCASPAADGQAEWAAYLAALKPNGQAHLDFIEAYQQTKSAAQKHWKASIDQKTVAFKAYCAAQADWQAARDAYHAARKAFDMAGLEYTETLKQVNSADANVWRAKLDIVIRSISGRRVCTAEMMLERARAGAERKEMDSRRE